MNQLFKLAFGLLLFSATIFAQEIDFSKEIPFDSSVKTGKLANGLNYYIKSTQFLLSARNKCLSEHK